MNVSPIDRLFVKTKSTAELKLVTDSTDLGALRLPKGSGIGNRAHLRISAKFPFSWRPYMTTGRRIVKGTVAARTMISAESFERPYELLGFGVSASVRFTSEYEP